MGWPSVPSSQLVTELQLEMELQTPFNEEYHPAHFRGTLSCSVRKAKQLAADLAALTISELRSVQPRSTKVVLLDRGDGRAVPIAKRLQRFGVQRAFVVQGGFRCVSLHSPAVIPYVNCSAGV